METLDKTEWDVLIVGTGLQQSLLALYVPCLVALGGCHLTDAALEELCHARTRRFSMSMKMTFTAVPRLPLAYRKLRTGRSV